MTTEAADGSYTHRDAEGGSSEEAKAALEAMVPEGRRLIVTGRSKV